MQKHVEKLSKEQSNSIVQTFLQSFGERLKFRRKKVNLSQDELADCLDLEASTLSKYESGTRDMQVSLLPLISVYCDFPMYELFPKEESACILDVFAHAVRITVDRHKRQSEYRARRKENAELKKLMGKGKELKGYVYDVDGHEVYEPAASRSNGKTASKERYRSASVEPDMPPYSEQSFCNFIKNEIPDSIQPVMDAGQFLNSVDGMPKKEGLREAVADYIVDELVINHISAGHYDERIGRMYAYYYELYKKYYDKG